MTTNARRLRVKAQPTRQETRRRSVSALAARLTLCFARDSRLLMIAIFCCQLHRKWGLANIYYGRGFVYEFLGLFWLTKGTRTVLALLEEENSILLTASLMALDFPGGGAKKSLNRGGIGPTIMTLTNGIYNIIQRQREGLLYLGCDERSKKIITLPGGGQAPRVSLTITFLPSQLKLMRKMP
ncbi:hypothetical protein K474DRAFT_1745077 [Panus rudis PR-1116 ss-1]|nr:hypothetical protein K474DRAFT_1745077 [Panus rudis PR-1116 ss-1]